MKLAVIGSRSFNEPARLCAMLDSLKPSAIISGGAVGVDSTAARWAKRSGTPLTEFLPDYNKHGRRAPLVRNQSIIDACDEVLVFWDGESTGTAHAMGLARKAGKPVTCIKYKEQT